MKNIEKLEELPKYESKRFVRNRERIYHVEPFPYSHMDGFLMKNRGNSFDDIYSKYSHAKWVPTQYKTLEFFKRFVEVDTFLNKEGVIYYNAAWYPMPVSIDSTYLTKLFYIHPITKKMECLERKISRKNGRYKRDEESPTQFRRIGPGHQLIKLEGIWYEVTFQIKKYKLLGYDFRKHCPINIKRSKEEIEKLLMKKYNKDIWFSTYENVKFKQLNTKELRKNKLKND
jgi:hypothetical protein